jgi:hypothetical protein
VASEENRRVTDVQQIDSGLTATDTGETEEVEVTGRGGSGHDRIGVGSGDENVAKIQLAARWAELYAPANGDSLDEALRRFKRAYNFVDSVSKLVEPEEG